jgi:hypothetical protein
MNKKFSGDKIAENEMGGTCSVYGIDESIVQDYGW